MQAQVSLYGHGVLVVVLRQYLTAKVVDGQGGATALESVVAGYVRMVQLGHGWLPRPSI